MNNWKEAQPTVKDVAAMTGLSIATVSLALRSSPKIRLDTTERVRKAADALGYVRSPLVSALMARIRGSRPTLDQTSLAILHVDEAYTESPQAAFESSIINGVRQRAAHLGFASEVFHLSRAGLTVARMNPILVARGISGAILLPSIGRLDSLALAMANLSVVAVGHALPGVNRVCPDYSQCMMLTLGQLQSLGYRRIGLAVDKSVDERVLREWSAHVHAHNAQTQAVALPVLVDEGLTEKAIVAWARRHRPEVVLSTRATHLNFLRADGWTSPGDLGFCLLNVSGISEPCSGVDQRPAELGQLAVDYLVEQLYRNERGVPTLPRTVSIEGQWHDGLTTRQQGGGTRDWLRSSDKVEHYFEKAV